jgi:lipid A 4'-phosphatase
LIPVVVLIGLTIPFWVTDVDLAVEARFFDSAGGWIHGDDQPWHALYHYGVIPAWVVSVSALAVLIASLWVRRFAAHRRVAAFLVLVMIIGPGLLVNEVFKKNWGRPRPRDVFEFAGDRAYVPVWTKNPPENGNAFASGHASTGFYLIAPFFFLRGRRNRLALLFLVVGLLYGSWIGLARMIQGAHFLSDVVWAAGFVYLSCLGTFYSLRLDKRMTT